ncbi:Hypothetical predicted protein [Olea europaea subsp. europaea]|uniref:Uncharacterized protein n=1 Tax=Olea europaea subsp. europaea TaxID=158383 RepID=A0A8S0PV94_OLEEU|nr:Hypothetical predicted protein [Olea europaea subsp. europaea]
MAHVLRPLIQLQRWHHHCSAGAVFYHILNHHFRSPRSSNELLFFTVFPSINHRLHFRSRALKQRDFPSPSGSNDSGSDSDSSDIMKKSRNEKKREARRAVRWGMELASFSPLQIKRILRVASLEQEVFDALMLVKRLGRDVREGKRRQFNYIGRLLRDVEPELMDGLIQATKDGDQSKFQELCGSETLETNEEDGQQEKKIESENDEEDSEYNVDIAIRWFEGLVNKDIGITNEIYSLQGVEFDRQELRKLLRKVHSTQEQEGRVSSEGNGKPDATVVSARRSLDHFLRGLVKQLPV